MDAKGTLIQLLRSFRDDVQMCMQNESKDFMLAQPYASGDHSGQSEVADPILLGDFVVDAYNQYVGQAQELTRSPIVHALLAIAPLGEGAYDAVEPRDAVRPRTHGTDPRLGKMAEVLLAAGQLLRALQAETSGADDARNETVDTLLTALDSLAEQVTEARKGNLGHELDTGREATCALAERYNTILDIAYETCDDPIVPRLFTMVDVDRAAANDEAGMRALAELATNQASLAAYLRKLVARSEQNAGMRGEASNGDVDDADTTPALAG
jgi:hypothetical protein